MAWLYLKVSGWEIEGELPDNPKAVVIAAPHSSNWDGPHMLAVAWAMRMRLSFLAKHTIFRRSVAGAFFRWAGGIPVDRRASHGVVAQVIDQFDQADKLWLAIAPAGTRSRGEHWKSGFYHIAHKAQAPVVCAFLDYKRKVGGVGPSFIPTGDVQADMDRIRKFYEGITACYPDQTTPVRLVEEKIEHADAA